MRRPRGFTLIELMVVIVILGGLIGIVGLNVLGSQRTADECIAAAQLARLADAVQAYRMQDRRLPGTLAALTLRTDRRPDPLLASIPKDPWGNEYEYRVDGHAAFTLRSAGEDGVAGTEDDVVWPRVER